MCLEWLEIARLAPIRGTKLETRAQKKLEQTFLRLFSKEEAGNLTNWRIAAAKVAEDVVAAAVSCAMASLAVRHGAPRPFDPGKVHANMSELDTRSGDGRNLHTRLTG